MSTSVKANRKGRNLYNYSTSSLSWKGSTRRNTLIGKDCIQNRLGNESYMRHSNYDGRPPLEVKKCTTLSRAIAVEEHRRRSDVPAMRARPGFLGDTVEQMPEEVPPVTPENQLIASVKTPERVAVEAGAGGAKANGTRLTWIDTRQQPTPPQQHRSTQESPACQEAIQHTLQEVRRASQESVRSAVADAHRGSQQPKQQPQQQQHQRRQKAELGSSPEAERRHTTPAKHASNGSQSQPTLSPAQQRRATSPEKPSSPRVPPGSDTGVSFTRFSQASTRSPRPGSSVYSDGLDNSRMSQAPSGSSQFGTGERLDPRKWSTVVAPVPERMKRRSAPAQNAVSAHDEYVVEQLWRRRDEAVGDEREELDRQLGMHLHERAAGSPRMLSPRPMVAAFTDRALRKREGMGCRAAFSTENLGSQLSTAPAQSDCGGCISCKPQLASPAGNPSHSIPSNVHHFVHRSSGEALQLSPQTPRQKSAPQGRRMPGSPNYNSGRVAQMIRDADLSPRALSREALPTERLDEHALEIQMGIKAKPRSRSADPTTAGRYRRKHDMDLETEPHYRVRAEGCVDPMARNEVAMILSPRSADPPAPRKITSCKRADGENKNNLSAYAEKISVHWNQPLYRYECAAPRENEGPSRSASLPSSQFVTFLPTGERSPRGEAFPGSAGDYVPAGWMSGGRRCAYPRDSEVAQVTNHVHLAGEAARVRTERLANDQRFSDLCAFTQERAHGQAMELNALKEKYTTRQAQKMASALTWHE